MWFDDICDPVSIVLLLERGDGIIVLNVVTKSIFKGLHNLLKRLGLTN